MPEIIHIHLIDKQAVGKNIGQHIPLHMTVLPWSHYDRSADEVIRHSKRSLRTIGTIATTATQPDLFGPHNDIPVIRLDKTATLETLHMRLKHDMEQSGAYFGPRWTGADWSPHVTNGDNRSLKAGEVVCIDSIDIMPATIPKQTVLLSQECVCRIANDRNKKC